MALPRVANDNANEVIVKQTDLLQSVSNSITKLSKDFTSFFSFEKERAKAQDSLRKSQAQKRAEDELEGGNKSKSMWNIDKLIDTISNLKLNLDGIGKAFTAKSGGIGGMIGNALIAGVVAYFVSDEFKAFVDDSFKSVGKYMDSEDFKKLVDDSVKTLLDKIDWTTAFSFLFGWRGLLVNAISKLAAEKLGEWADDAANWIIGLANKGLKHFGIKIDDVDIESEVESIAGPLLTAAGLFGLLFPKQFFGGIKKTLGAVGSLITGNWKDVDKKVKQELSGMGLVQQNNQRAASMSDKDLAAQGLKRGKDGVVTDKSGKMLKADEVNKRLNKVGKSRMPRMAGKAGLFLGIATAIAGGVSMLMSEAEAQVNSDIEKIKDFKLEEPDTDTSKAMSDVGGVLGDAAIMALTGAAAGGMFGPIGMAIGGAVGGLIGAAQGYLSLSDEDKDNIKKTAKKYWDNFVNWIGKSITDIINNIGNMFSSLMKSMKEGLARIVEENASWIPFADSIVESLRSGKESEPAQAQFVSKTQSQKQADDIKATAQSAGTGTVAVSAPTVIDQSTRTTTTVQAGGSSGAEPMQVRTNDPFEREYF